MLRQSSSLAPLAIVCFALLLPAAYPLSYLALSNHVIVPANCGHDIPWRCSDYRLGGDFARTIYRPLQRLDQWVRPAFWDPTDPPPRPMSWRAALEALEGGMMDLDVEETLPGIELPDFSEGPTDADTTERSSAK